MILRSEIMNFLDDLYLKDYDLVDYCRNGLQIEGRDMIEGIVLGVTISQRLIEAAIEKNAQMIICHHGLFTFDITNPPVISGFFKDRLKLILENEINLVGYHLPMDVHPEYGHNSLACKHFGLKEITKCDCGYIGFTKEVKKLDDFVKEVKELYERRVDVFAFGKETVERVAVISGGGSDHWQKPLEMGADIFITGEMDEHMVRKFEEMNLNVIAAGHYHTERLGVIKLAELLKAKFDIKAEFVEVETFV